MRPRSPGLPVRALGGDGGRARDPVGGFGGGEGGVQGGDPGPVREEVADQDALLAVRLELRPVGGDRCVQVDLSALVEHERDGAAMPLPAERTIWTVSTAPRLGAVDVPRTGPQVDDLVSVAVDGDGRTPLPRCSKLRTNASATGSTRATATRAGLR
ncbi:hypothetical protein SCALM49S_05437 [Streptomyces californicus]